MDSYNKNVEELLLGLREPAPIRQLRRIHPEYLRVLLHELRSRGELTSVEVFAPALGLVSLDAVRTRYLQRLGPTSDVASFLTDLLADLDSVEPGELAVLWLRLSDEQLSEPLVVSALGAFAERVRMAGLQRRVLLSNDLELRTELGCWAQETTLSPPKRDRKHAERGLDAFVQNLLGLDSIDPELVGEVARAVQGLDAAAICEVVEGARQQHPGELRDESVRRSFRKAIRAGRTRQLGSSTGLEVVADRVSEAEIGGLVRLKRFLAYHAVALQRRSEARDKKVDLPRGILLVGLPGCGKSLAAKAAAGVMQLPLLRLDVGGLMGRYLGESERNLRIALAAAEAAAPCVLWVDELEKALGGMSGDEGGGTGKRMLGQLLTWMQEQQSGVYLFATANAVKKLPPELLRRGRFDELFRVDLPNLDERKEILRIHLRKRDVSLDEEDLDRAASEITEDYTGSDIESLVKEAKLHAFIWEGVKQFDLELLKDVARDFTPLCKQFQGRIQTMQEELRAHGFRNASFDGEGDLPEAPPKERSASLPPVLERLLSPDSDLMLKVEAGEGSFCLQIPGDGRNELRLAEGIGHERIANAVTDAMGRFEVQGDRVLLGRWEQSLQRRGRRPNPLLPRLDDEHPFVLCVDDDGEPQLRYTDGQGQSRSKSFAQSALEHEGGKALPLALFNYLMRGKHDIRFSIILRGERRQLLLRIRPSDGLGRGWIDQNLAQFGPGSPLTAVISEQGGRSDLDAVCDVLLCGDEVLLAPRKTTALGTLLDSWKDWLDAGLCLAHVDDSFKVRRARGHAVRVLSDHAKWRRAASARPQRSAQSPSERMKYRFIWQHVATTLLIYGNEDAEIDRGFTAELAWSQGGTKTSTFCRAVRIPSGWAITDVRNAKRPDFQIQLERRHPGGPITERKLNGHIVVEVVEN